MSQLRSLYMLLHEDFREVIKSKDVDLQIKQIVRRHSALSDLLIEMSDAFGAIFTIHVLFLSVTICFYGIAARINARLEDLNNFLISVITAVNIYNCCRHGQLVTDSAVDVATVAYDSVWEDLSCKHMKIILLAILRSQQASYIRSMKCSEISLKTFITIMNMTWSFISLVTKLYQD
ncbi:odorant receptor 85c-like [Vanessa tameamea]|uniref:Odorant receptor 85c-like n=1 Tax=Vanessa tameamea TaxID=334116 RepID=A0A8B8I7D0_VANTA